MTFFSLSHLHIAPANRKRCFRTRKKVERHALKSRFKKEIEKKKMSMRLTELKVEMEEISEEQNIIKEGQLQVREKLEAIEAEYDQLRKETNLLIQQSAHTQLRLVLMFKILKAREENDFTKAAQLTLLLREIIARTATSIE